MSWERVSLHLRFWLLWRCCSSSGNLVRKLERDGDSLEHYVVLPCYRGRWFSILTILWAAASVVFWCFKEQEPGILFSSHKSSIGSSCLGLVHFDMMAQEKYSHSMSCPDGRKNKWTALAGLMFFCLVVWNINFIFPYIGNNNTPNWRTHIFQRGRSTTNQFLVAWLF